MDQIRLRRLEGQIREEISSLVSRGELKDPRIGPLVSITRVEASRDGSHAKIWVSCITGGDKEIHEAVEGFTSAAGFIQSQIAKRVRLRLTPLLHFFPDPGIREGFEMTKKIEGLAGE